MAGERLRESGCSVRRRHCNQRFTSFLGTFCGLGNRAWGYGGACTPIIALNRVSVAFAGILRGGCGCLVVALDRFEWQIGVTNYVQVSHEEVDVSAAARSLRNSATHYFSLTTSEK